MSRTIALAGTFDTKGKEFLYAKQMIESLGLNTFTIHTGVFEPEFEPDVSNEEIFKSIAYDLNKITVKKDRAEATELLAKGMETLLPKLYEDGKFDGILSFGGSGGTSIVTAGMRALPVGVPKVMVSTMTSGNIEPYVGTSDILMMPSIVDVAGLNTISTKIFSNAVHAIAGMVNYESDIQVEKKPLIAATMFGLTTPCINFAKDYLENEGYEVVVFHATGTGGRAMESLVEQGFFEGVLDMTTTEWADELFGGVLNAGPERLNAAALHNIPQVVSLGALDMVNFGTFKSVPEKFAGRNFYKHNPTVTLMRTTKEENELLANKIAEKLNQTTGKTTLLMPLKGLSGLDIEGQQFYGPEENEALFKTLDEKIDKSKVEIIEVDKHINDEEFAQLAAKQLINNMKERA